MVCSEVLGERARQVLEKASRPLILVIEATYVYIVLLSKLPFVSGGSNVQHNAFQLSLSPLCTHPGALMATAVCCLEPLAHLTCPRLPSLQFLRTLQYPQELS